MTINIFTSRNRTPELFSDLRKDLVLSPISEDLAVLKNENAVKESLKNLILTDRGERLMQPFIGGGVRELLFENLVPSTIKTLENRIKDTIELYEPRCELIDISVTANLDENSVNVGIKFYVSNVEQPSSLDIIIERIR
jgi:phage baseplate assembly protein W